MYYEEALNRLFQLGSKLHQRERGLKNAHALDLALKHPTTAYPSIHIAGSNGKGSVATKIAKALELSGYRVGLYTSPHLIHFHERIVINGEPIPESALLSGLEKLFALQEALELSPSYFEMATFLAFDYFRREDVDVAIIETGIGGRLDPTNVIHPILSVITSISLEHAQILGSDLEKIAAEKAGIIKEGVPVVLGPKARYQAIQTRAREMKSPVHLCKNISYFYDVENSATATLSLKHLAPHFNIPTEAIERGVQVRPACRFEQVGPVIFDVAHNPDAIFSLLQALHTFFPDKRFRFLVGFSQDKEYDRCLGLIADVATHIHLVSALSPRAASPEELQLTLKSEDPRLSTTHPSVEEGMVAALAAAQLHAELLVVCGSFYIMESALRLQKATLNYL